ncbi:MAG: pre-peptidase C-terminal domain-containing protein [Anaerolineales bacterium]
MKKKVWIFLLALGLVFTLAACGTKTTSPAEATATPETEEATPAPPTESGEDEEPSSDPEEAPEVSMGTLTGTLDEGSEDWYTFEVADGHVLSVEFTAGEDAESMNVQLLGSEQNEIWVERRIGPTVTQLTRQVMSSSSGGTYYIKVSGGHGEYSLELAAESQDDAGSGGDAGDRVADALQVEMDQTFSGEIANFDAEDWYAFEVPDGHVLNVKFTAGEDAESMNVQLLGPEQNEIWVERRIGPTVTESVEVSEAAEGTYYIRVSDGNGSYTIDIE